MRCAMLFCAMLFCVMLCCADADAGGASESGTGRCGVRSSAGTWRCVAGYYGIGAVICSSAGAEGKTAYRNCLRGKRVG